MQWTDINSEGEKRRKGEREKRRGGEEERGRGRTKKLRD
jgi:hypothetical protein